MAKALLIIDMLRDFLEKDGALFIGNPRRYKTFRQIAGMAFTRDPVIYIMDRHLQATQSLRCFRPTAWPRTWQRVVDALAPRRRFSDLNGVTALLALILT